MIGALPVNSNKPNQNIYSFISIHDNLIIHFQGRSKDGISYGNILRQGKSFVLGLHSSLIPVWGSSPPLYVRSLGVFVSGTGICLSLPTASVTNPSSLTQPQPFLSCLPSSFTVRFCLFFFSSLSLLFILYFSPLHS